jgi:hypothetical protein
MQLIVAVDTGLFASDILSTLPNPTIAFIPLTVPVNVGLNLLLSLMQLIVHLILVYLHHILSTFVKPTIAFVIPLTVPVKLGLAKFAFKFNAANCALILVY